MRFTVRFLTVAVPVLAISAAFLMAANLHLTQSSGLTVHEWGTFTSVAGEDGSAIEWDALGCSSDLPRFVNDYGYRGLKRILSDTVRMETPVMYFYSPQELEAHVKVSFPQGLITEWYPQAEYKASAIEWRPIKIQPNTSPAFPIEGKVRAATTPRAKRTPLRWPSAISTRSSCSIAGWDTSRCPFRPASPPTEKSRSKIAALNLSPA